MAKSSGVVLKKLLESYTVDSLPTPKGRAIVIDSQTPLLQGFEVTSIFNIDLTQNFRSSQFFGVFRRIYTVYLHKEHLFLDCCIVLYFCSFFSNLNHDHVCNLPIHSCVLLFAIFPFCYV
jgi:hypothetical protein